MSFQDPRWLWLLALVPLLWLLARRGVVAREREVASLFLWRKALAAQDESPRARRRPVPPSLWAWAASVAALVFALAEPLRAVMGEPRVLLLVEDGARMQAKLDGGVTRFDALQEKLDALLASLPPSRVSLQTIPGGAAAEGSVGEIRPAVARLTASREACRLDREIAARRSSFSSFDAVVLGSDRQLQWDEAGAPGNLHLLLVGAPSRNVGWASFFRSGDGLTAVVKNFSAQPQTRTIEIESTDRVAQRQALRLAAGEAREIAFGAELARDPGARIRLDPPDEFALDDDLRPAALPAEPRVRVPLGLAPSLARAFAAIPGLKIVEAHGTVPREEDADIFLIEAPAGSAKALVRLHASHGDAFGSSSIAASGSDPLAVVLGFEGVRLEGVRPASPSHATPLAYAADAAGKRWPAIWREGESLVLNFSLETSDWDRHPSFPVFWAAWVEEIRAKRGSGENFLRPEQSDTNGVSRALDRLELPPGAGSREEPLSSLMLIAAALSFLAALFLESKGK